MPNEIVHAAHKGVVGETGLASRSSLPLPMGHHGSIVCPDIAKLNLLIGAFRHYVIKPCLALENLNNGTVIPIKSIASYDLDPIL